MEKSIAILVACNKSLVSELLISAFSRNPRFKVVAHATSKLQVLEALSACSPDVILLDGETPCESCETLEILAVMRQRAPRAKPVILLDERSPQRVVELFRSGARGVFSMENADFTLLCKCVDCVFRGQFWASSEELGWIIDALEMSPVRQLTPKVVNAQGQNLLSKREEDVVGLLMEGLSNREIAQTLQLSEHTIKNYLFRIFDKLGVSSRTELLLYAMNFTSLGSARDEAGLVRMAG